MDSNIPIRLNIPVQDLTAFTQFELTAEAARAWALGLAVTDAPQALQQLRKALSQLNRVQLPPASRSQLMQALQPTLERILSTVARRFLNQPLVLPGEAQQQAELADSCYDLASTAYVIVAVEAIRQRDAIVDANPARLTCEAIHHAIVYSGRRLLHTLSLYRPVPQGGWRILHQLYNLAEKQGLTVLPVSDPLSGGKTISAAYLQTVLLGCCHPNQQRQSDLHAIYTALARWCEYSRLEYTASAHTIFLIDLGSDQPPVYREIYSEPPIRGCRYINNDALLLYLEQLREGKGRLGITFDQHSHISGSILDNLITSLSTMSLRNFGRANEDKTLSVCVGLSGLHYHIGGNREFEYQLHGDDYTPPETVASNPFLPPLTDDEDATGDTDGETVPATDTAETGASDAAGAAQHKHTSTINSEENYPVFTARIANASPGGYCLEWSADLPGRVRNGDLVGLKENHSDEWIVAVIRWVNHLDNTTPLVGLELLSPRAVPYGACIRQKNGALTEPMRVLLLPEIQLVGQPHTLLTPRAGFHERQKIVLVRNGEEFYIRLQRQVAATDSFSQFDFRYMQQLGQMQPSELNRASAAHYDSLWSKL